MTDTVLTGRPDAPTARLLLPADASHEEWLAVRRSGIGGSDLAGILGLDKRRGPRRVYEEKLGFTEPENSYMRWGRRLEPVIAEEFSDETGLSTAMPPGTLVHIDHPWALANVDRYVLRDGAVAGPLECKNKSEYLSGEWDGEEAPDGPALQAHWYQAVGGWQDAWLAGLIGGNRLRIFHLPRNEELIEELIAYAGAWYQRHIVEGFVPPVDGLESTKNLLARLWDVKPEAVAEVEVDTARDLRAQRAALKAEIKALEDQLTTVENTMRDTAKDAEIVRCGTATAWTWKANGTFAAKRFREEQPELAAQYTRTVEDIDTDALKAAHPAVFTQYRARVLRVPAKEL
ncbi:YqaJ viral recombinase family protein [Streptomyces sp. ME03-5709C]|nr:YqaJ viral recombinase family protein [Streptomyces sp. ME03-5709C]